MIPFSAFSLSLIKQAYVFVSIRCLEKDKKINIFLNLLSVSSYWLLVDVFLDNCYLLHLFVWRSVGVVG